MLINDNYEHLKRFFDEDFTFSSASSFPTCPRLKSTAAKGNDNEQEQQKEQQQQRQFSCFDLRILYVYRTFYDRLVEKEVTVLEEVPHVATPEPEPTKEKRRKGRGGAAAAAVKEKRNRGDLKDEDAEVKLDRDFLLDGAAGKTATTAANTGDNAQTASGNGVEKGSVAVVVVGDITNTIAT